VRRDGITRRKELYRVGSREIEVVRENTRRKKDGTQGKRNPGGDSDVVFGNGPFYRYHEVCVRDL